MGKQEIQEKSGAQVNFTIPIFQFHSQQQLGHHTIRLNDQRIQWIASYESLEGKISNDIQFQLLSQENMCTNVSEYTCKTWSQSDKYLLRSRWVTWSKEYTVIK